MKPFTTHLRWFLLSLFITSTAFAGSATATLTVTTSVEASCPTFNVSPIAFAAYSGSAVDQTGTVTINCTSGASYDIALNAGNGTGATVASRYMTNQEAGRGDQKLEYRLYSDSGRTALWGDGSSGTTKVTGTADGTNTTHTIYGRVTAGQTAKPGQYQDTVTVTLTFN